LVRRARPKELGNSAGSAAAAAARILCKGVKLDYSRQPRIDSVAPTAYWLPHTVQSREFIRRLLVNS
jgi:hypothetical protein